MTSTCQQLRQDYQSIYKIIHFDPSVWLVFWKIIIQKNKALIRAYC